LTVPTRRYKGNRAVHLWRVVGTDCPGDSLATPQSHHFLLSPSLRKTLAHTAKSTVQTPRSSQREFLSVRSSPHDPGISSNLGAFVVRGKRMIRSVERRAPLMKRMISSDAASPPSDQWLGRFSVPVIPAIPVGHPPIFNTGSAVCEMLRPGSTPSRLCPPLVEWRGAEKRCVL